MTTTHVQRKLKEMAELIEMGELKSPGGACCAETLKALLLEAEVALREQAMEIKGLRYFEAWEERRRQ